MNDLPHSSLDEYKTQAALLLKQLRSTDSETALTAAKRFQQLPYLAESSLDEIANSDRIKLKHALNLLAHENNFADWSAFKVHLQKRDRIYSQYQERFTMLYPRRCSGFINEWHSNYELASTELGRHGGYLLPYKNQYFICAAAYIDALGLDPDDPDWEQIGYNWVQPADQDAWERLNSKMRQVDQEIE